MSQKVANNIFSLVLAKVASMVLVFVGYAALSRYLGKVGFGQFQFVISYVILFGVVVDFGIQAFVIKKVSEDRSLAQKYLGNFFVAELFLAFGIYVLLSLIAYLNGYDLEIKYAIFVAGFGMFLNALSIPYTAIISAYEDMHILAWVNFFDSVINAGIMFSAILLGKHVVYLALVQVLMGCMHMVVYNSVIRKYVPHLNLWSFIALPDWTLLKSLFQAAWPFGLLVGFSVVYNKIDVVILQHMRGYADTGLYTIAYKFVDLLAFFPAIVSSSLYPFFSHQIKNGSIENVRNSLQTYTRYMIAIALPLAIGGALLAPRLITLFGGQDFYPGFAALQILVFASAVVFIYAPVNSLMINQLTRYAVIASLINVFLNAIGNIVLIPHLGFRAAAVMTLVSEVVQASIYFYFVMHRIVKFNFFGNFVKPLFAASIMGLCLYGIRFHSVFITIPLGVIVYGIVIGCIGFFHRGDLEAVRRLIFRKEIPQTSLEKNL